VVWSYDANVNPGGMVIGDSPTGVLVASTVLVASKIDWILDYLDLNLV
jgi:hypothetical protein